MTALPTTILARLEPLGMRLGLGALAAAARGARRAAARGARRAGRGHQRQGVDGGAARRDRRRGRLPRPGSTPRRTWRSRGSGFGSTGWRSPTLELDRLLERWSTAADGRAAAPRFEALTAAAFLAFAEEGVELAVLEVGLGGRLDATNVGRADAVAWSRRSRLDHQEQLGSTLAAIAAREGGHLARGRPALAWGEEPERRRRSARGGADEWRRRCSFAVEERGGRPPLEPDGLRRPDGSRLRTAAAAARAAARARRARTSCATSALAVAGRGEARGAAASSASTRRRSPRGVAGCRWPGRLEAVALPGGPTRAARRRPQPRRRRGARRASSRPGDALRPRLRRPRRQGRRWAWPPRWRRVARRVLLAPPGLARGRCGSARSPRCRRSRGATPTAGAAAALERALGLARPHDGDRWLVVSGSLYLVGEARRWLRARYGVAAARRTSPPGRRRLDGAIAAGRLNSARRRAGTAGRAGAPSRPPPPPRSRSRRPRAPRR